MKLDAVIDQYIESKKRSGIAGNSYEYSDFLNLKARLLELKTMFGYCSTNKETLKAIEVEYYKDYSPYAPSLQTRKYVLNQLMKFIETIK